MRPKTPRLTAPVLRRLPTLAALGLFATLVGALELRELDLTVYWRAAQQVYLEGTEPYARPDGTGLPFTYPPTAFFLLAPLAGRTLEQASALLASLNLALALAVILLLPQSLARTNSDPAAAVVGRRLSTWGPLYVAAFGGLYLTLHFQQVNLLLLLCLWGFWWGLRRTGNGTPGRSAGTIAGGLGAGAALALGSIAKPHYGILLVGALGCLRRAGQPDRGLWMLLGTLTAGVALFGLSLALAPAGSWQAWLEQIVGTTSFTALPPGHSSIAAPWNRSIPGEVARWLVQNKFTEIHVARPALAAVISTVLVLALATATAWAVLGSLRLRARRCSRGEAGADPVAVDLELSLLSVWVFLAAPASWTHHLVMLLPAALVLLRDAVLAPRSSAVSRLAAGLVLAVLALTLDDLLPREIRTGSRAIMGLMTVAVVGLWALLLERLLARNAAERRRD
jgi:hypothetical protein